MAVLGTVSNRPPVDPGMFAAKVVAIEAQVSQKDGSRYLRWTFDLNVSDAETVRLTALSSLNTGARSKLRKWAEAIIGREYGENEEIDSDDLVDRPCFVVVEHNYDREGIERASIISVIGEDSGF